MSTLTFFQRFKAIRYTASMRRKKDVEGVSVEIEFRE